MRCGGRTKNHPPIEGLAGDATDEAALSVAVDRASRAGPSLDGQRWLGQLASAGDGEMQMIGGGLRAPRLHPRLIATLEDMPAYVISEVEIIDEAEGQRYRELAAGSIARHGGRYLVRGAAPDVPEGDWRDEQRVVVVEFPSMDQLQAWYESDDYAGALAISRTALRRRLLFVEGVGEVA